MRAVRLANPKSITISDTDRRYDSTLPGLSDAERQVLSYPDNDVFFNTARNRSSPYFKEEEQREEGKKDVHGNVHGSYDLLPALYTAPQHAKL